MKKKGLVVLLLLVAMLCAIAFSGCSLVKLNEDRQANRIMATISYDVKLTNKEAEDILVAAGYTDYNVTIDINRRELITAANYAISYYQSLYQQYYGTNYNYDYETVLSDTLDSLIANRYYVARGVEYLLNNSVTERLQAMYMICKPAEYKAVYGNKISPEGVLTMAEWYSAVGTVNENFVTRLESYRENSEEKTRNDFISSADNRISEFYQEGYFVSDVAIARKAEIADGENKSVVYKNVAGEGEPITVYSDYTDKGEKFVAGLYTSDVVVKGTATEDDKASDASEDDKASDAPDASELEADKVYALIELTKKTDGGNEVVYVPRPVAASVLTIARESDADFIGAYVRTRSVTTSFSGRVYAKVTESNDTGYTTETFTSDPVEYKVAFARNALTEKAEEVDQLKKAVVRYASKNDWETFLSIFDATKYSSSESDKKGELNKESDVYKNADDDHKALYEGLAELYSAPFSSVYNGEDKAEKDAYRQLHTALVSANIGFVDSIPADADKDSDDYKNYTYYNGLYVHFSEQFMNQVLSAVQYEAGENVIVTMKEIEEAYKAKVLQDKVKYDTIGYSDQLTKFFSDTADIAEVFYVPFGALNTQYEIKATDKAYAPLFNADGTVKDSVKDYVIEKDGKFYMTYIYENNDGTYTINAFFVAHILFNFENVEKLKAAIVDSGKSIAGYQDADDATKLEYYTQLAQALETNKQIAADGTLQEDVKSIADLYELNEDGTLKMESANAVIERFEAAVAGLDRDAAMKLFEEYTVMYNDDSGKMKDPGYMIISGDVSDGWVADFSDTSKALYYQLLAEGKDPNEETVFGSAYGVYGRHYLMIEIAPYYHVKLKTYEANGDVFFALDRDTVLNVAGDTQTKLIGDALHESKASAAYSDWQASFGDEKINASTTRNEKNYKSLLKDIKDKQ